MPSNPISQYLTGPQGRLFAEPHPGPDMKGFRTDNTSAPYYNSAYYEAHKNQVQPIPAPRKNAPASLNLADFAPSEVIAAIQSAGKISFHATGDTGATKVNAAQLLTGGTPGDAPNTKAAKKKIRK